MIEKLHTDVFEHQHWHKLREIIQELELLISHTPTGDVRDRLTEANVLLHTINSEDDT